MFLHYKVGAEDEDAVQCLSIFNFSPLPGRAIGPPPTALFPLPLPAFKVYEAVAPGQSRKRRAQNGLDRALHVVICALNFSYFSSSFPDLQLIRRQPNEAQTRAIGHLRLLLRACDPGTPIKVAASGRKNLHLLARLQELTRAALALGFNDSVYHEEAAGTRVLIDNSLHPKLTPFRSLCPERLKISGKGNWEAGDYMSPELWMAFVEPRSIEMDRPVFSRGMPHFDEDQETALALFRRWDALELLTIHDATEVGLSKVGRVKIFNTYKSEAHDRQIGDRRARNAWEGRLLGPSRALPVGPLITRLLIPDEATIRVCITDRSDFYHQIKVTHERSKTNCVWPPVPLSSLIGTRAYSAYLDRVRSCQRPLDRVVHGDLLAGEGPARPSLLCDAPVFGSFQSVLQGDQLGVEFGISAHAGFLQEHGLLRDGSRLQSSHLIRPSELYEGLVIDDYFTIATVPTKGLRPAAKSKAFEAFCAAKRAYRAAGLAGSDEKDIIEQDVATVVGAELNGKTVFAEKGLVPVGAPAEKRLALSWISLHAASFPYTTDALHSSIMGALISAACFRRCLMGIFVEAFTVIPALELSTASPSLRVMKRVAATELCVAAVLLPVMVSNIKASVATQIFASDASNEKGAYTEATVDLGVAQALWQSGDFKGSQTSLEPWHKSFLKEHDDLDELEWRDEMESPLLDGAGCGPQRELAQYFDFIEVCGGSGVVSDELAKFGFTIGPIIDISYSPAYDVMNLRAVEWLLWLVQNGRVRALALEPPCASFFPATFPAVRSYRVPRGFNQKLPQVRRGNSLAFSCLAVMLAASEAHTMALLEQPRRSKMAWLREWSYLKSLPNFRETHTASCSFGSPHQKEFRFLTCNMLPEGICFPCTRDHQHVKIEGSLTSGSATYCQGLAEGLARLFARLLGT